MNRIKVEVAYANLTKQLIIPIEIEQESTALQAIEESGILKEFPEIDLEKNKIGIFGHIIKLDKILQEKDRVEIYRPLIADPKESRKKRAAKK